MRTSDRDESEDNESLPLPMVVTPVIFPRFRADIPLRRILSWILRVCVRCKLLETGARLLAGPIAVSESPPRRFTHESRQVNRVVLAESQHLPHRLTTPLSPRNKRHTDEKVAAAANQLQW